MAYTRLFVLSFDFVPVPSVPSDDSIVIIYMTFVSYSHWSEDVVGFSWETESVFVEVVISEFSLGLM